MSEGCAGERPVALISGASRGIGRATAVDLAAHGYDIFGFYGSRAAASEETAKLVADVGGRYDALRVDGADEAQVVRGFAELRGRVGRGPAAVVVSAGITGDGLAATMSAATFDRVIAVNLRGAFLVCRQAFRAMRRRGGSIVLVSSVSGLSGQPGQANYSASKGGVNALTQALAKEGAPLGIRVNAVAPGYTDTDMLAAMNPAARRQMLGHIPMGRTAAPAEIASVIRFALSPDASYMTGQVLVVDGGLTA
ncbi:MAG: SDR family oxidoreductase [Frankiaceae bacterium]|nr:SDR family oxidoreductase [Frankiaceae bacterium]